MESPRKLIEASFLSDAVENATSLIHKILSGQASDAGLMTGFKDFDRMTYGLHPQEMTVLAARPSVGKTSLAMNIAEHVACEQGKGVLVFSLEMGADQLAMRLLTCRAKVSMQRIKDRNTNTDEQKRLAKAAAELKKAPLWIDENHDLTVEEIRSK